ncbi:Rad17 cell cycle checkpoint protein-domain-containing protein, partial [Blyttiomyces helicus]
TILTKALTRVADLEFVAPRRAPLRPSKAHIEAIARASCGDVRCALTALQFSILGGDERRPTAGKGVGRAKPRGKAKAKLEGGEGSSYQVDYIGGREPNLDLFHSLGKILYAKRVDQNAPDPDPADERFRAKPSKALPLPSWQTHQERVPLRDDPERVLEATHLDAEGLTLFLGQNSHAFFADIDEMVSATGWLSDADVLLSGWSTRPTLGQYASTLVTRGLMHAHTHPVPPLRFHQMHRPEHWKAERARREGDAAMHECAAGWARGDGGVVGEYHHSDRALATDIVPYVGVMMRADGLQVLRRPRWDFGSVLDFAPSPARRADLFTERDAAADVGRPSEDDVAPVAQPPRQTLASVPAALERVDDPIEEW